MNNTFDIKRFLAHAIKHYTENIRQYIVIIVVMFLTMGLLLWTPQWSVDLIWTIIGFANLMLMGICGQIGMKNYTNKQFAVSAYTQPSSIFEKYIFIWFNSLVVCNIITLTALAVVYGISFLVYPNGLHIAMRALSSYIYPMLIIHAIAIFSSSALNGRTSRMVFITLGAILLLTWLPSIPAYIAGYTYDSSFPINTSLGVQITADNTIMEYDVQVISNTTREVIDTIYSYALLGVLWVAGYFKFKERELK